MLVVAKRSIMNVAGLDDQQSAISPLGTLSVTWVLIIIVHLLFNKRREVRGLAEIV